MTTKTTSTQAQDSEFVFVVINDAATEVEATSKSSNEWVMSCQMGDNL